LRHARHLRLPFRCLLLLGVFTLALVGQLYVGLNLLIDEEFACLRTWLEQLALHRLRIEEEAIVGAVLGRLGAEQIQVFTQDAR